MRHTQSCSQATHTFLDDGGGVVLVVLLLAAGGGRAQLQAAAHLQDGHAGGHAHTWNRQVQHVNFHQ